jgi:hypothetical protein
MSHKSNHCDMTSPLRSSANELELNSRSLRADYRSFAVGNNHLIEGKISARVLPSDASLRLNPRQSLRVHGER